MLCAIPVSSLLPHLLCAFIHTLLPASESPEQSSVQLPSIMMVSTYHVAIRIKTLGPALMH